MKSKELCIMVGSAPNLRAHSYYSFENGQWWSFLWNTPLSWGLIQRLRSKHGGAAVCTAEFAIKLEKEADYAKYGVGTVTEITEAKYSWALECLPPAKWDGTSFANPEALVQDIYDHFTKYQGRWFRCPLPASRKDFVEFMREKIKAGDFVKLES